MPFFQYKKAFLILLAQLCVISIMSLRECELFTVSLQKGQTLGLFWLAASSMTKINSAECTLMPLKSQSKVRRPCRQASQFFMSRLSLFFPSFYAFIKQTNKSPEQKLMSMIDCAQCCYNACVIPCFINNWSETTGNFGFEVVKEELRWTLQMKEYVRLGKIGLLSSCEHMGEYF